MAFTFLRAILTPAALLVAVILSGCDAGPEPSTVNADDAPAEAAEFAGSEVCAQCHESQHAAWLGSHHRNAMQVAGSETVLGDFEDSSFEKDGVTTRFFRRGEEYWVNTANGDGVLQDFLVAYTFGVDPLQQYLIELPGGRFQALSVAWDSRAAEAGGQRWFHLYPEEVIDHEDPLHWTGTYQRWNTMCADCHSTDLDKAYSPEADSFATTFSEISVGCEACHGPGSRHLADPARPLPALQRRERVWAFDAGETIARLVSATSASEQRGESGQTAESGQSVSSVQGASSGEIEVCAQCHSRRSQLDDDYRPGQPFLDAYRPALLDADLYHADGQILDEVYVYGSFMQSAMAAAGVTCSDCHDPHTSELRATGNAVCATCHLATAYDVPEHHRHAPGSESANCVSCHMRSETYMVVDPRRDHSFRVPRPDLSARIEVPNACNDCHDEQDATWAADRIREWFPNGRQNEFHYGEALAAGRDLTADAPALLRRVVEDSEQPAIVRATALSLAAGQLDDRVLELIRVSLADSEPLVRLAALDLLTAVPPELRRNWAQAALTDPLLALRISAARGLVGARDQLSPRRTEDLNAALAQYIAAQRLNGDRAEGLANLAGLAAELGQAPQAESWYLAAIERNPGVAATYVNLADLYRAQGREADASRILEDGLRINPEFAGLAFALGLSLVRTGSTDAALSRIREAVELAPNEPYYAYVLGVAVNSMGDRDEALEILRANRERFPGHQDTLIALATISRDAGELPAALGYARALLELSPSSATARSLVAELEAALEATQ